jgi:hypothetical protein
VIINMPTKSILRQLFIGVILSLGATSYGTYGVPAHCDKNRLTIKTLPEIFDKNDFGRALQLSLEKAMYYDNGSQLLPIFRVIAPMPHYKLTVGDYMYLDLFHKDHFEVFTKDGYAKLVVNLDGSTNRYKTLRALSERRRLRFTLCRTTLHNKYKLCRSYSTTTNNALSWRLPCHGFKPVPLPMKRFSTSIFSYYRCQLTHLKHWLLRRFI